MQACLNTYRAMIGAARDDWSAACYTRRESAEHRDYSLLRVGASLPAENLDDYNPLAFGVECVMSYHKLRCWLVNH